MICVKIISQYIVKTNTLIIVKKNTKKLCFWTISMIFIDILNFWTIVFEYLLFELNTWSHILKPQAMYKFVYIVHRALPLHPDNVNIALNIYIVNKYLFKNNNIWQINIKIYVSYRCKIFHLLIILLTSVTSSYVCYHECMIFKHYYFS